MFKACSSVFKRFFYKKRSDVVVGCCRFLLLVWVFSFGFGGWLVIFFLLGASMG